MGFFNLFNNTSNNDNSTPYVTLVYNSAQVSLTEEEARGRTVSELFSQCANRLGISTDRISKYLYLGKCVEANALITANGVYSATHTTESKG